MGFFETKSTEEFDFQEVLYEKKDWVARVTINRPHNYNAYSTPALQELTAAFTDAALDDKVAVIVFTGAGDRAFCTGGDVKEYEKEYCSRPRDYWKYMGLFRAYIESILNSGKPTIARLNGMAVGGGNESQLACDLAVIAEHACRSLAPPARRWRWWGQAPQVFRPPTSWPGKATRSPFTNRLPPLAGCSVLASRPIDCRRRCWSGKSRTS